MQQMNLLEKLYRADDRRRSRFHTASGTLCLNPVEMAEALGSTVLRHTTGKLIALPWLTFPAIRFLKTLPKSSVIFEYGCGMSTVWHANHFAEVHGVESNAQWFARVKDMTRAFSNVSIALCQDKASYTGAIENLGRGDFNVVIIDGQWRADCVPHAFNRVKRGGYIVLDNSDVEDAAKHAILARGVDDGRIFSGFLPGIFHPGETTFWQVA